MRTRQQASSRGPAIPALLVAACLVLISATATLPAAQATSDRFNAAASKAGQAIEDAGKSTANAFERLWKKTDLPRVTNRTPEEIGVWVIIGLMVGGILAQTIKLSAPAAFTLSLAGAIVGGLVARVSRLDLGFGSVLIRYEDVLLAAAGSLALVFGWRLYQKRKQKKE